MLLIFNKAWLFVAIRKICYSGQTLQLKQIRMFGKDVGKLKLALEKLNRELPTATLERKIVEQRSVPQVKALYSYNKHGIDVVKGELMFLVVKVS